MTLESSVMMFSPHPRSQRLLLIGDGLSCRLFLRCSDAIRSETPEQGEVEQSQRNLQRVPECHFNYDGLCRETKSTRGRKRKGKE